MSFSPPPPPPPTNTVSPPETGATTGDTARRAASGRAMNAPSVPTLDFRHGKAIVRFPVTLVRPWLEIANLEIAFPEGAHASAAGQGLSAFKSRRGDLVHVDLRIVTRELAATLLNSAGDALTEAGTACPTTLALGPSGALIESRWRIESREAILTSRVGVAAEGASIRVVASDPALYAWLPVSVFEWIARMIEPFAAHVTFDGPASFRVTPLVAAIRELVPRFGFKIPSLIGVVVHRFRRDGSDLVVEFAAGAPLLAPTPYGTSALETPFASPLPAPVATALRANPRLRSTELPEPRESVADAACAWLDVAHGNRLEEALRVAERALAIDDKQIWAWNIVALTREQEVDHRAACDAFVKMADLWFARGETADGLHALLAAARAIRHAVPTKGVEILARAHRETPQNAAVLQDLLVAAEDAGDRRTQIRALEALLALPTRTADERGLDWVLLGGVLLQDGRFDDAAQSFARAGSVSSVAHRATLGEARARLGAGDSAAALALLDPLLPAVHRVDESLWLAASIAWVDALEHAGRLSEAFGQVEQLIQSQANLGEGSSAATIETLRRGTALAERLGHHRTAKQWLYALLQECDPRHGDATREWIDAELRLARILSAEADVSPFGHPDQLEAADEALSAIAKVLAVNPKESEALKLRPRLLRLIGRIGEVAEALARSVEFETNDAVRAEVLYEAALTVATSRGDERETLRYLTLSLEADPSRREVHESRARLLRQLGEWRSYVSACRDWLRVCEGKEAAKVAHEAAIALARRLGDSAGAIKLLADALNNDDRHRGALEMLANLAEEKGNHALAARALEGLAEVVEQKERPHIVTRRAKVVLTMGLVDEAAALLADPEVAVDPEALETRVRIALERGDVTTAAETLDTLEAVIRNAAGAAKTAQVLLLKADVFRRTGDAAQAIAACRRAQALFPGVAGGSSLLAELLDGRVLGGREAGAVAGAETDGRGREDSPRRHGVTEEKGQDRAAGAGAGPDAVAETDAAVDTEAMSEAERLTHEAEILRERPGGLSDAITKLEQAVAVDATFAPAWHQLADALFEVERWHESLAALDSFIATEPRTNPALAHDRAQIHVRRGQTLEALGQGAEAETEYRVATELDHDNEGACMALARLSAAGARFAEAVDLYARASAVFQTQGDAQATAHALTQMAQAAESLGDLNAAIEALLRASHLRPADTSLWPTLRALFERTEDWPRLVDTAVRLGEFTKSARDERDLLFDAGRTALLHLNDDERAFDILHRVFEIEPNHPPLILLLGEYHLSGGEPDEAEGFFKRLVEQEGLGTPDERSIAWRRLGEIAAGRGRAEAACAAFTNAVSGPIHAPTGDLAFDLQRARVLREAERLVEAARLILAVKSPAATAEIVAGLRAGAEWVSGRDTAALTPDDLDVLTHASAAFHEHLMAETAASPWSPNQATDDAIAILESLAIASSAARDALLDRLDAEVTRPLGAPPPERIAHLLLRAARAIRSAPDLAAPNLLPRLDRWMGHASALLDAADAAPALLPKDAAIQIATTIASFLESPKNDSLAAAHAWARAARLAEDASLEPSAIDGLLVNALKQADASAAHALSLSLHVARAALHSGHDRATILAEAADAALRAGQSTDDAVELFGQAHQADPTWPEPLARSFALLVRADSAARAVDIAALWCDLASPSERVSILRERAHLLDSSLHDPDAAIRDLRAILAIEPRDIDAHKHLARLALTAGDATTATTSLETVAALATDAASIHDARLSLVTAYQIFGRHAEAKQLALGLVLANPTNDVTLTLFLETVGKSIDDQNDLDQIDRVLPALETPALRAKTLTKRGEILLVRVGQREAAEQDLLVALRLDPRNVDAARMLRQMKIEQGDRIAAAALLRQEIDATPGAESRGLCLIDLARLSLELGDAPGALEAIDEARALAPTSLDAWDTRNKILVSLGRFDEAEASLCERIALDTAGAATTAARLQLGALYLRRGAESLAEEEFRSAWKAGTRAAFEPLAVLLTQQGRWEDLYEAHCRLLDSLTEPADRAHTMLAMAELLDDRLGRPQAAVPLYRRVMALQPADAAVIERLTALHLRLENWNALTDLKSEAATKAATGVERTAALLDAARFAAKSGRTDDEAEFLRQVLEGNPLEPHALAAIAQRAASTSDPAASGYFARLDTVQKLTLEERLAWAAIEEKEGRDGASLVQLEIAHALLDDASPELSLAFWEIGARVRLRVGDRAGAIDAGRRAVSLLRDRDPVRAARVLFPIGKSAWESGRPSDAVEIFEEVTALDPSQEDALNALVELHVTANRGRHALAALDRLLTLAPSDARACALLMRIGEINNDLVRDLDAAESAYRRAIAQSGDEWLPRRRLFFVLVEKGDTAAATRVGEEIAERFAPGVVDADFLAAWGDFALRADRLPSAQAAYGEYRRLRPDDPRALHALAEIARRSGETDAAERYLSEALDAGKPDATMSARELLELARVILADAKSPNRIPRAITALRRAVSLEPILEAELLLGSLLAETGSSRDEAVALFERRLDAIPFDAEAHRQLAALFASTDPGRAAYHSAIAAFLNPALPTEPPPRGEDIQAVARRVFRDGAIPPILVHPHDRGAATEMLRLAGPYLADLVPNTRTRDVEPYAAPAEVQGILRAAGIRALAIAITTDPTVRFSFAATAPPTLVLARSVATSATATDWRFIAGRAAALVTSGGNAVEHLGPRSVEEILQLICKLCASDIDIVGVDPARVAQFLKRLKTLVPRAVRKQIAPFAEAYVSAAEPMSFSTFAFARHATANRVGLALAGDLSSALNIIARLERSVTQLSAESDERRTLLLANSALADLVKFAGSADGLQLLRSRRT